jgi:hypothetical protein
MSRHVQRTRPRGRWAASIVAVLLVGAGCGSSVPSSVTQPPRATQGPIAGATPVPTTLPPAIATPTPSATAAPAPGGTGAWTITGSAREGHSYGSTATVLRDGRVLVVGGEVGPFEASGAADLYDPRTGQWTTTGSLHYARRSHSAVLLADGRVLVAGGWNYAAPTRDSATVAEIYDPMAGTWSDAGRMIRPRSSAKAVALTDGRVLVLGGNGSGRGVELFQPTSGQWRGIPGMTAPPEIVVGLGDGRVLVTHGALPGEVFDPVHDSWTPIPSPGSGWDQAVAFPNGSVLLLDGEEGVAASYDPTANAWTRAAGAKTGRGLAATLPDGSVLMVGDVSSARRDPRTGAWTRVPRPPLPRDYALGRDGVELRFLLGLHDGRLLATDGGDAAIFDPAGVSEAVADLPATGSYLYPGRYMTAFEPALTLSIAGQVRIDCAPGFRCRGDVDVNSPNWVDLEFGHDHPIDLMVMRLDGFVGANGRAVAPPADLANWVASRPHLTVLNRTAITVGGKPATQLDIRSDDRGVVFGPTGLKDPAGFGFGPGAYRRLVVVQLRWANVIAMIGSVNPEDERDPGQFASAIDSLQPIVDSIGWY